MKIHFERESIQQKQNPRINSSVVVMKKKPKKIVREKYSEKNRDKKKQITKETE